MSNRTNHNDSNPVQGRINVALLYGGKSGEHEVSLRSAASVVRYLNPDKYNVIPIGMDKEGHLFVNDYQEMKQSGDVLPVATSSSQALDSLIAKGRMAIDVDVVFPVVHGPLYEDGCLQGLLSLANVAYVGCDVLSSALGMDKDIARRVACIEGIRSARYRLWSSYGALSELDVFADEVIKELGFPLFVKPCSLGSSVGIHKINTRSELLLAIKDAARYDQAVLVEEFIIGREIELAVLESSVARQRPHVTIPGEIHVRHKDGFYSYTAKYLESEYTDLRIPADLTDALIHQLQIMAQDIFSRLKCRGMARVDFFVNDETSEIYFNEINTLPGFTAISMYPKLWQASGLSYDALLDRLIELALMHYHRKQQLVTHYS